MKTAGSSKVKLLTEPNPVLSYPPEIIGRHSVSFARKTFLWTIAGEKEKQGVGRDFGPENRVILSRFDLMVNLDRLAPKGQIEPLCGLSYFNLDLLQEVTNKSIFKQLADILRAGIVQNFCQIIFGHFRKIIAAAHVVSIGVEFRIATKIVPEIIAGDLFYLTSGPLQDMIQDAIDRVHLAQNSSVP